MKIDWKVKKLGEVCGVIAGQSPEGKYYNNTGEGLPFYQGKKEFNDKFIGKPTTWTTVVTKMAQQGDILLSVRAPAGPVNFCTEKICIGRGLASIRVTEVIDMEYLYNFLLKHEKEIVGNSGAVFNSINKLQIENILIPVPPFCEQQRIVAIIDEAFDAIERAKENAEKNLQNARDLFESYLQNVFANPGDGWEERTIEESFRVRSGIFLPAREMKMEGSIDVFGGNGITGKHDSNNLDGENIIIGRVGAKCGNVRLVRDKIWITDNAFYISKFLIDYNLKFLKYQLDLKDLRNTANQAAQPVISYSTIKNILLVVPPLKEQEHIVAKLDDLFIETKKLEVIYKHKLTVLEELKKSILQKAFNGEL